jgi:tetratricopeptide (TPR) repeat protein
MKHLLLVAAAAAMTACSSPSSTSTTAGHTAAPSANAPATTTITATTKSPEALTHFKKGTDLFDNLRTTEAAVEFAEALKLDPDFALAHVYHGLATPGPEGVKEIEAAAAASGSLPEPERTMIEGAAAGRRGDLAKAAAAYTKVTELVPGDWRGHYVLGQQLLNTQKYDAAVVALKKATELNPNAGGAQNMLGYAALRQGDANGAIAAFEEYTRILPKEPNPQDSLGEALVAAGRFKDAEAAFQKALTLSPEFWAAHQGIGYARFYGGDVKGGREAFAEAKKTATEPTDKISVDDDMVAVAVAQRETKAALAILDGVEKTTGAGPSEVAFVPVRRALVLNDAGRYKDALVPAAAALATADGGHVTSGLARNLRRQALVARITSEAGLRDAAAATKTSAMLDEAATAAPDSPLAQSAMHYGRGMLALAKGDAPGARTHFDACSPEDELCKWQGVVTAGKAGDKAGAAKAREQLLKVYARDPVHLIVRARLTPAPAGTK